MEKVIYTWFDFTNGANVSACTIEHNPKKRIDHSCECGLKITISVPDGYHVSENESGYALLVKDGETIGMLLQYNNELNRIEEGGYSVVGNTIKGVRIISKEEF